MSTVHVHNHPVPQGWLPDTRVITYDQPIHFPVHRLPQDFMPVRLEGARTRQESPISHVQALWMMSSGTPLAPFGGDVFLSFASTPPGSTMTDAEHEAFLEESVRAYGEIWQELADR